MLNEAFWEKEKEMVDKLRSTNKDKFTKEIIPIPPEKKKKVNPY